MWDAERENAERISQKYQLVSAGVFALLGLGLFSFEWMYQEPSEPLMWRWAIAVTHLLLIAAVICYALSLGIIYLAPAARRGTATSQLEPWREKDWKGKSVRLVIQNRTLAAYTDLRDRNRTHWTRYKRAQRWLSGGLFLTFLAILLYLNAVGWGRLWL